MYTIEYPKPDTFFEVLKTIIFFDDTPSQFSSKKGPSIFEIIFLKCRAGCLVSKNYSIMGEQGHSFGEKFWVFCAQPGVQKTQKSSFLLFSPDFFWKIGLVPLQLVSICAALSNNITSICLCSFWIEQGQVTAKSTKNAFCDNFKFPARPREGSQSETTIVPVNNSSYRMGLWKKQKMSFSWVSMYLAELLHFSWLRVLMCQVETVKIW